MENKEAVLDRKIVPLVKKIMEICEENEIPVSMQFVFDEDENVRSTFTAFKTFGNSHLEDVVAAMHDGEVIESTELEE